MYLSIVRARERSKIFCPKLRVFADMCTKTGEHGTVETVGSAVALRMLRSDIQVLDSETIAHGAENFRRELCSAVCQYTRRCAKAQDPVIREGFFHVDCLDGFQLHGTCQLGESAGDHQCICKNPSAR